MLVQQTSDPEPNFPTPSGTGADFFVHAQIFLIFYDLLLWNVTMRPFLYFSFFNQSANENHLFLESLRDDFQAQKILKHKMNVDLILMNVCELVVTN